MKRNLRKFLCGILLSALLAASAAVPAFAAGTARISIRTAAGGNGQYVDTSRFTAGDTIYLPIQITGVNATCVRGFTASVAYDESLLSFDNASFCAVQDKDAYFMTNASNGKAVIAWDTTAMDTVFSGDVFYLQFTVNQGDAASVQTQFTLDVKEFYESVSGFPDIAYQIAARTAAVTLEFETVPSDMLQKAARLETVTADSLADITAAETAFHAMTTTQQQLMKSKYPTQYEWLSTARTRYNRAVEQAGEEKIAQLALQYQTRYGEVLKLTVETVAASDRTRVQEAKTAYGNLPSSVTSRLDRNIPKLLSALLDKIDILDDCAKEVREYRNAYGYLMELTDTMLESGFSKYSTLIDEAVMVFDTLLPESQTALANEIAAIRALQGKCDAIAAADEAEAALRAKVSAFQQKWLYVFTLNNSNVTVGDKSAIKMVLADYEKQEDEVRERLASRMKTLHTLLTAIEKLEQAAPPANGGTVTTPVVTPPSGATSAAPPVTPPAEGAVQDGTGSGSTDPVVKTERSVQYLDRGFTSIMWLLFIVLAAAVLSLAFPLVMTIRYRKRLSGAEHLGKGVTLP